MLQRAIDAFNARDLETYFGCFDHDLVYRSRADEPDAGVRKGLDELKRYTLGWLETFNDLRFDVHEWIDLGDQVIGVAELQGRGSATGPRSTGRMCSSGRFAADGSSRAASTAAPRKRWKRRRQQV
jgi:ketosteroid isomerase-like protein